eukprot:TRINITY_DN5946_c0_g1_i1.p1 TRINITY_DN5946_c0_g1~~TRINITY_DN5946_c0_g1_i1.p1  ORF type:complete len:819 (-),score=208.16 TRINITY_DN5946_c0_g1_i1:93-2426(-)
MKDKRRTFIGTPYWIAPEVVNTVIAPYDTKCDIWSLGITCVEMAELQPPLHQIAPMTAVLQIPKNPAPVLADEKKWSADFHSFLADCFVKDPAVRKGADELLQHPFIANITWGGEILVDTIKEAREVEEAYIRQAELEGSGSESDSDDDESYGTGSFKKDSTMVIGDGDNSKTGEYKEVLNSRPIPSPIGSPSQSPIPSKKDKKSDAAQSGAHRSNLAGSPPVKARPKVIQQTLKKTNKPQNIAQKKLFRMQLKHLKKLMQSHELQQGKQVKSQQNCMEELERKVATKMNSKHKYHQKKMKKLLTDQSSKMEDAKSDRASVLSKTQKNLTGTKKQLSKEFKNFKKREEKDHKSLQKKRDSQWKSQYKKLKKKKAELAVAEQKYNEETETASAVFSMTVGMQELTGEHKLLFAHQLSISELKLLQLGEIHELALEQLHEVHEFKLALAEDMAEAEAETLREQTDLESQQQREQHELQKEQVINHHNMLTQQQLAQVRLAVKMETKDFKDQQKKGLKEFSRKLKKQKLSRAEKRTKLNEFKTFQSKQDNMFDERQNKLREEKMTALEVQQRDQIEVLDSQHAEAKQHLIEEHKARREWLDKQHQRKRAELLLSLYAESMELLMENQQTEAALQAELETELNDLLSSNQAKELLALQQFHLKLKAEGFEQSNKEMKEKLINSHEEQKKAALEGFIRTKEEISSRHKRQLEMLQNQKPADSTDLAEVETARPESKFRVGERQSSDVRDMTIRAAKSTNDSEYQKLLAAAGFSSGGVIQSLS